MKNRFQKLLCFAAILALLVLPALSPQQVDAQLATSLNVKTESRLVAPPKANPMTARDEMYRRLADEQNALTRQYSLLKQLIKTVSPSVAPVSYTHLTLPTKA